MTKDPILVSIIIPSYNHGRFVVDTLQSALAQRTEGIAIELLIIDDGSTDDSLALLLDQKDAAIQVFSQPNQGAAFTLNRGLSLARGAYIAILNSDDLYHPNRLSTLIEALEARPDCQLAVSKVRLIDEANNPITDGADFAWLKKSQDRYQNTHDLLLSVLIDNFTCTTSNFLFRKSLIEKIGAFSDLRYVHDLDFLLRSILSGEIIHVDQELLSYRVHRTNTIKEKNAANKAEFIFELSWVIASLMENPALYQRVDIERLISGLLEAHRNNIDAILFMHLYFKKLGNRQQLLQEEDGKSTLIEIINQKIAHVEYVNRLVELRDLHAQQAPSLQKRIEQLKRENSLQAQRVADLTDEFAILQRKNETIWKERLWFQSQFERILNSKRFRLFSHIRDITLRRNLKYNSLAILKLLLPLGWKQRLKHFRQRNISLSRYRRFLANAYSALYRKLYPPIKIEQAEYYGPLVSIISPCYNYGAYLDSFIDCLQKQTFSDYEVILIDDGSTDISTIDKIREIEERHLDYLRIVRQNNQGVIAARNNAINAAKGKYIFPLDPDDVIDPTFLEKCLLYLESSPSHYFVYSWTYSTGESHFIWETYDTNPLDVLNENRAGFIIAPREALFQVNGYNPAMREGYEDWELVVNLVRSGYVGKAIPEPLYHYNVKQGSRNFFAKARHEQLKELIRKLHADYLYAHESNLKKAGRLNQIVTNPLINLSRKQAAGREDRLLIEIGHRSVTPEQLARILNLPGGLDKKSLLTCAPRWMRFFHLNARDELFAYFPEHYHPYGNAAVTLEYFDCAYRISRLDVDRLPSQSTAPRDSQSINILYIAPWMVPGGADIVTIDWFKGLDNARFNKYFVTTEPKNNAWIFNLKGYAREIYELPALGYSDPQKIRDFVLDLIALKDIRIVHVMNSRIGYDLLPAIKQKFHEIVTVAQFHCFDYLDNGQRAGYPHDIPMKYDAYIDFYNVVSLALQREILESYSPIDEAKFKVIYCCIDTHKFDPERVECDPEILALKRPDCLNLLFIGRLDRQKQPLVMAQVALALKERGISFVIHVLGEGNIESQHKDLQNYIRAHDLADQIILHGVQSQDRIMSWYKIGDIVLMTSAWEGIPIVLYEAMAMGLPCVAPNVGGIEELMRDGCGVVIDDREDVEQYVHALERLYHDPILRETMGIDSRRRCREFFDITRMQKEYDAFYSDLVHGAPRNSVRPEHVQ
ncbi:MAG: glycosyltransferase [Gammaproteobacteria bacterium]|nr:glycosyltransferase [Gammaproteobacteria bacterium]